MVLRGGVHLDEFEYSRLVTDVECLMNVFRVKMEGHKVDWQQLGGFSGFKHSKEIIRVTVVL